MAGRSSKLTPETVTKIEQALAAGATYRLAAEFAGIAETTLHDWRKRRPEFSKQLSRVEAAGSLALLARIKQAGSEDWRAAAWILERRYPQEYGRTVQEVQGKDGGAIAHQVDVQHSGAIEVRAVDYRLTARPLRPLPLPGDPGDDDGGTGAEGAA